MLSVVVAERPEDLLDELAADLAVPLADAFSPELVSIFSLGMTNWVKQQLSLRLGARSGDRGRSGRDGIVANISMPTPAALRHRVLRSYRVAIGSESTVDPWARDQLVWSILEVLADQAATVDPLLARVAGPNARVASAAAISKLFDGYNRRRPEMVLGWLNDSDVGPDGQHLSDDQLWQPRLLRRLREHIRSTRGSALSPPEEASELLRYLHSGGQLATVGPDQLPQRLFIFGESSLPGEMGPLLQALAVGRDVRMLLLSPSVDLTRRVAAAAQASVFNTRSPESPTWAFPRSLSGASLADHPLVQNWGQPQSDLAVLLGGAGVIPDVVEPVRTGSGAGEDGSTLLGAIQRGITADRVLPLGHDLHPGDRSVRIHGATGPTRQVEVLRDQILDLLNDNPDLREEQVVVICPRLDVYAPIIAGVWGASASRGSQPGSGVVPALRYTIVNQSAASMNPLFGALDELLDMVPGRFTDVEVRAILGSESVRRKFDLDDGDLDLIDRLTKEGRVRWGLNGRHRSAWNIDPEYQLNSWEWGVHQMMTGVALGDDLRSARLPGDSRVGPNDLTTKLGPGGVPPLVISEGSMAAAGKIAGAIAGLKAVHGLLGDGNERPIEEWVQRLIRCADLMLEAEKFQGWQRSALDSTVESLLQSSSDSTGAASRVNLSFADFQVLLAPALKGTMSRASMTHGSILVSPPGVVASVPYKVVCILGLDSDSILPSTKPLDDLTASSDWIGDADGRQRARADLLAAVQSARENVVITCTSTDINNNRVVPRAVVLEEFFDVIGSTLGVSPEEVRKPAAGVYVAHTRQAFDPANFAPVSLGGPVSYDPTALKGAMVHGSRVSGPLSQQDYLAKKLLVDHRLELGRHVDRTVELADLVSFFTHPAKAFLRSTLGVTLSDRQEVSEKELPTSLGGLDAYAVGQALLDAGLRGDRRVRLDPAAEDCEGGEGLRLDEILEVATASGLLPPASIARDELDKIHGEVRDILAIAEPLGVLGVGSTAMAVDVRLPSGARLVGSVDVVATDGHCGPVNIRFSRPNPKLQVEQAIQLLALAAVDPSGSWLGVLITRLPSSGKEPQLKASMVMGATPDETRRVALDCLDTLVGQFQDGSVCALPLFARTSRAKYQGVSITSAWGVSREGGEARDVYNDLAFGPMKPRELEEVSIAGFTLETEASRLWGSIENAIYDASEEVAVK